MGSLRQVVVQSWSLVAFDRPGERLRRRDVPLESDSACGCGEEKKTSAERRCESCCGSGEFQLSYNISFKL